MAGDVRGVLKTDGLPKFPYISSSCGEAPIPGGTLISEGIHPTAKVDVTVEIKTHAVMVGSVTIGTFASLTHKRPGMPEGLAMRFKWPSEDDSASSQTRMLVQVIVLTTLDLTCPFRYRSGPRWYGRVQVRGLYHRMKRPISSSGEGQHYLCHERIVVGVNPSQPSSISSHLL
jgi:hypothetical protein